MFRPIIVPMAPARRRAALQVIRSQLREAAVQPSDELDARRRQKVQKSFDRDPQPPAPAMALVA
jgi:hypothetical protein